MVFAFIGLALNQPAATDYRSDLNILIDAFKTYGAYVREDRIDLEAIRTAYAPKFADVQDRNAMVALLEAVVGELHDFHASLGTNNDASPRLVPSGTDVFAHWRGDVAIIDQVRAGSIAEKGGLKARDIITRLNGASIREASHRWFGVRKPDARGWSWALNSALAGRWNVPREVTLLSGRQIKLATALQPKPTSLLVVERREGSILHLRPQNCLGDVKLIAEFDRQIPAMRAARRVVIDLRDTPSGGNTSVARGIMGLFIRRRAPYQRHRVVETETDTVRDWVEYATPRLAKPVETPLVVLVDRWTGSMGEGIAIGLDALHRAKVIGTEMARLRGAIDHVDLPKSGISVNFPTEQVFHVDGTPRHEWLPPIVVKPGAGDPWWDAAKSSAALR